MADFPFPNLKTKLPGPEAKKIIKTDDHFISPSYTRGYPCVADVGRGMILIDVDGNEFLDFCAGIAVCSTGHCHPEIVKAIECHHEEVEMSILGVLVAAADAVSAAKVLQVFDGMEGAVSEYGGHGCLRGVASEDAERIDGRDGRRSARRRDGRACSWRACCRRCG